MIIERFETIVNNVIIEGENFTLVRFDTPEQVKKYHEGNKLYALINHKYLDSEGKIAEQINMMQMFAEDTVEKSMRSAKNHIICNRWRNEHPDASETEYIMFISSVVMAE